MSAPIELRYYLRLYTLDDALAGMQPNRQFVGDMQTGKMKLFAQPSLQWRIRERAKDGDGNVVMEWSDWQDVKYFREGDDASPDAQPDPPKAA